MSGGSSSHSASSVPGSTLLSRRWRPSTADSTISRTSDRCTVGPRVQLPVVPSSRSRRLRTAASRSGSCSGAQGRPARAGMTSSSVRSSMTLCLKARPRRSTGRAAPGGSIATTRSTVATSPEPGIGRRGSTERSSSSPLTGTNRQVSFAWTNVPLVESSAGCCWTRMTSRSSCAGTFRRRRSSCSTRSPSGLRDAVLTCDAPRRRSRAASHPLRCPSTRPRPAALPGRPPMHAPPQPAPSSPACCPAAEVVA